MISPKKPALPDKAGFLVQHFINPTFGKSHKQSNHAVGISMFSIGDSQLLMLLADRQRYDAVMNAPNDSLFRVDKDKKRDEESPKV